MSFPRHPRLPSIRLVALAIAASAAAMIGLGSAAAHAAPTTSSPTTGTPTTGTATTSSSTARTSTTGTPTTGTATTTKTAAASSSAAASTSSSGPATPPGPPCAGQSEVLTPVLCIPTGFGEDQPAPIGTDGFVEFAGQVVDNGPAVLNATVVITLPPGLRLDADEGPDAVSRYEQWWSEDSDDDGTALACTANSDGSVITCATGAIAAGANFLVTVDLDAQDNAVVGTSADFTMALQSTPDPGIFPTTTVQATVDYVGTAHLQVNLTPTKATVVLGKSLTVTATVHNVGPNPAVEAAGVGFVFPDDFSDNYPFLITNSQPFPGGYEPAFVLRTLASRTASATAAAPVPSPLGFWPIGTIAPGATVTVQIVVKAVKVGQVDLDFDASSADESCDSGEDPTCENDATAALTAVAAATTTVPPTTATATAAATTAAPSVSVTTVTVSASASPAAALPNTGFQPAPWVGSGAAAILLGGGLMVLGMPRRRVRGRHR